MTHIHQSDIEETDQYIDILTSEENENDDVLASQLLANLNFIQKMRISLFGSAFLGNHQRIGWMKPLPLYAFQCTKHGLQVGHPAGWKQSLICLTCFKERNQ